jgi:V/A-type H+-transporting ATPase subunit D
MARLNIHPTRMELTRLKRRLRVARRGHKLLKDKRDELMKQFLEMVRRAVELRAKMEELLLALHRDFLLARAQMPAEVLDEALMLPARTAEIEAGSRNVMSVEVPALRIRITGDREGSSFPYGIASTSAGLDEAILSATRALPVMLELAEAEKASQLLAMEIEKTRRRVNALEYVMIPQMEETAAYIAMKLEENERGSTTRLMKVKDMMLEQARRSRLAEDAGPDASGEAR